MLTGVLSPTLVKLMSEREAERARLGAELAEQATKSSSAAILPHPALLRLFKKKSGKLGDTLNGEVACGGAAQILSTLIESVTTYPASEHGAEAEVVARTADLVAYAANKSNPRRGGSGAVL